MQTGGSACESVFILGGDLKMKCSNVPVISELRRGCVGESDKAGWKCQGLSFC